MNKLLKILSTMAAAALVTACGGGGGSAGSSPFGSGGNNPNGSPQAADIVLTSDSAQIVNTGSDTAIVSVTAIDGARNAIAGVPVTISADGDAILAVSGTETGADGTLNATVSIGANRGNRLITVTATSGGIAKSTTLQVVGTTVTSVLVPAVIGPSTAGQILYRAIDESGNALPGQSVQIVATGLTPGEATGTTDANGEFVFNYTSPAATGSYQVTAVVGGVTDTRMVPVQTTGTVPAVTTIISSASISANPSVVAVNLAGSGSNRSEIRALFLGANNLPVPNVRVRFDLNGDANSIGGTFTTGSTTLYSDANGVVTTAYVPASRSSPTNGVTVRACYGTSDTDPNLVNCPASNSRLVTLTVTAEPLGVTIGTNELIIVNELTYVKKFIVSVSDSAGVAKPDVNLVVSLDLPNYRKGFYVKGTTSWVKAGPGDAAVCVNEDRNRNGVLETAAPTEDVNGDGQLWPRKPDVIVSLLQSKTRADGTAELQITYAKDHGTWVDALITVSASGVSGTEGRATYLVAPVPVDAASLTNLTIAPAYAVSPYGFSASCANRN